MNDEIFMQRCFELAQNGMGLVAPNPLVGCVIVKDSIIIGEGFHHCYGGPHAEANAINSISDKSILENSTLYVNLEPCSHFGKTPPCCDLILQHGIKRVVVANIDPNPLVASSGIAKLKNAGLDVVVGILQKKGQELNKRFFTFILQKRPYIILKWAETLDGFIDIDRKAGKNNNWITNDLLKILVHKWRSEEVAILVGTCTAENDNPQLNLRHWEGKHPLRLVLDRQLRLHKNLHLFDGSVPTIVYTEKTAVSNQHNLTFRTINFEDLLHEIIADLYHRKIQSLIVEGGKQLLETFIKENLWDEARILIGNKYFQTGLPSTKLLQSHCEEYLVKDNKVRIYKNV